MASKKSTIPVNAQIPVAIILSIMFAFLLLYQFGPLGSEDEAPDTVILSVDETEVQVSVDDVKSLLADIQADKIQRVSQATTAPPLSRDPFRRAGFHVSAGEPGEDTKPTTESELLRMHEERLRSLRLSATSLMSGNTIAIINGRLLRVGDSIEGFVIQEVRKREVILEDEIGKESIQMPEVPNL